MRVGFGCFLNILMFELSVALTLKHKIGQTILMGLKGPALEADEKKFIVEHNIGGVILFSRNLTTPQQLHALVADVQNLRHQLPEKTPLFVGIDMEGGRVARLKAPFTQWPPLKRLGDLDSPSLGFKFAETMGQELKAIGINLNFAPCVDVLTNPKNTVIGDRSLSADAENVAKMSSSLVRGYIKSEIIPCAKHFPGHGNTMLDSHEDLPIEETTLERLREVEFVPFKRAFRARLDMVMTAHIKFPKIDPEWPATLSSIFITDILRKEMGYRNLIITDDLDMKALTKNYALELIPVRALKAGCQLLAYCNEPARPPMAIEAITKAIQAKEIDEAVISAACDAIQKLKKTKLANPDPLPLQEVTRIVGHPDHLALSKAILSGQIPEDLAT